MDEKDINRLLMQFDHLLRESNREHINEAIEELAIDDVKPIINLVARCRATYLNRLYQISRKYEGSDDFPTPEELKTLRAYRNRFIEMVEGAKAIETSIQRGYLDLKT